MSARMGKWLPALLALSAALAVAADQSSDTIAHLTQLSNNWDKVIWEKKAAAIAANMADDFRMIDGTGQVEDKKAFVAGIVDPQLTIDPYTVEEFDVRLFGDTALLSGRTKMTGTHAGKPFTSNYRYIDIYVRRNGVWKIVSVQITRFPPPQPQG